MNIHSIFSYCIMASEGGTKKLPKLDMVPASIIRKFYISYIHETFLKLKEKWFAYFAAMGATDSDSDDSIIPEVSTPRSQSSQCKVSAKSEESAESLPRISQLTFYQTMVVTTLGLGPLWRFPMLAYATKGGAFFILYALLTLICGYSLYFMELVVGQCTPKNLLSVFYRLPLLEGLGGSIALYGYIMATYYSQVVGIGIHYFVSSFSNTVPWSICPDYPINESSFCRHYYEGLQPTFLEVKCINATHSINKTKFCEDEEYKLKMERQCCLEEPYCRYMNNNTVCRDFDPPSLFHWRLHFSDSGSPVEGEFSMTDFNLKRLAALFGAWVLIFVLVSFRLRVSAMALMIPCLLMLIMLVLLIPVAVQVKEGWNGMRKLLDIQISDFYDKMTWIMALEQACYSLGLGMGLLTYLGSASRSKSPCHIQPLPAVFIGIIFSVVSLLVIFAGMENLFHEAENGFTYNSNSLISVPFVAYSTIIKNIKLASVYSCAFFFLFVVVTAFSVSCVLRAATSSLYDCHFLSFWGKHVVRFVSILLSFLASVPMAYRNGLVLWNAIDRYPVGIGLLCIISLEIIVLILSGINGLIKHVCFLLGTKIGYYHLIIINLSPVGFLILLYYQFRTLLCVKLTRELMIAFGLSIAVLVPLLLVMIVNIVKYSIKRNPVGMLRQK